MSGGFSDEDSIRFVCGVATGNGRSVDGLFCGIRTDLMRFALLIEQLRCLEWPVVAIGGQRLERRLESSSVHCALGCQEILYRCCRPSHLEPPQPIYQSDPTAPGPAVVVIVNLPGVLSSENVSGSCGL